MSFDYDRKSEYGKWALKKEKEEKKLRAKGVSEEAIKQLREMDKLMFNAERKYLRHTQVVKDDFWESFPDQSKKDVVDFSGLLDEIENEILYEIIKNSDEETQKIIELKYQGYVLREISSITKLSIDQIKRKIQKIRKIYKKAPK